MEIEMGLSQAGGFSKVVDPMLEKMQRFEKEKEIHVVSNYS